MTTDARPDRRTQPAGPTPPDERATLRRGVYAILIFAGVGGLLGRIGAVDSVDRYKLEEYYQKHGYPDLRIRTPFLSANDRSRWLTIRSLVEHGTYRIDEITREPNWDSIDVVKHDGHGRAAPGPFEGHLYSSKPPLLSTILAGEYWLIYRATGYSLKEEPYLVGRFMLATINIPCLVVIWLLVARHVERYGRTDWGRIFVVAAAVFGTLQTSFATALNNHLIGAVSAMIAFDAVVRIACEGDVRILRFVQAGLFAAFTAANELPALSLFAAFAVGLLWKQPWRTLVGFAPAAALVGAAALGTNYAAHETIVPAYAHRKPAMPDNDWYDFQYVDRNGKVRDSYWSAITDRSSVDKGEPSRAKYALHALIGHHGIFSLTPVFIFSFVGLGMTVCRRDDPLRPIALALAIVSLVCIAFYLTRGEIDRNYGGTSAAFRWALWFAPLWLAGAVPAVDAVASRRGGRAFALVCLAVSVISVSYPTWNPWTHPWPMQWMQDLGWDP
jgi:hypothetical protein